MLTKIKVYLQFGTAPGPFQTLQSTAIQSNSKTHVKMPCGSSRLLRDGNHVIYQNKKVEVQNAH